MDYAIELNGITGDEYQDIQRSLNMLYTTRAGSVPMDRDLGIDFSGTVDCPVNVAQNNMAMEIIRKTEKYEPRVMVEQVTFEASPEIGTMRARIRLVRGGEQLE